MSAICDLAKEAGVPVTAKAGSVEFEGTGDHNAVVIAASSAGWVRGQTFDIIIMCKEIADIKRQLEETLPQRHSQGSLVSFYDVSEPTA